jgi:phosphoribosyl-AMP cyclohydrolase/phosphoribosyl-ATP pyrophosphohydrolase/phosphoribosyl-AMP cyclohydrolase
VPVATPIDASGEELAQIRYNADGLVPAIVQEEASGTVLMMAWMTPDTVVETLATGRTVFWSRSRQERWRKGDTSGDRQWVRAVYYDCDGDVLLLMVEQEGSGACHTGAYSCFYRRFGAGRVAGAVVAGAPVAGTGVAGPDLPGIGVASAGLPGTRPES